jgi:glycosyltransferase involved in cell wall biosynthesis
LSNRRLRICHVITRMIVGGAQENTLLTVRGLMDKGHDVVLVSGPTTGPEGELLRTVPVPGLQVREDPTLVRELRLWTDLRACTSLARCFRQARFDVVHTHSSKAGIVGRIAAHRAGVPLVMHTVHGQAFHPYERWWRNRLFVWAERLAARRSHRILAVAQAMVEQCVAAGVAPRDKYAVVYSGMEIEPFLTARPDPELRRQLGLPAEAPVIGKIARLFELKGHDFLITAAANVVREFPTVRFLLVGDGALRARLEAEIAARGLSEHFVFAGLVPPQDIPRYTALMTVLVHLSLREGLPRTVVQALAAAVPAVGFALDGTPEVIHDGETGRLCHAGDVAAVSDAILGLLRDPPLARRLGAAGREFVRNRFDWRHMVDQIEAHYFDCLNRGG